MTYDQLVTGLMYGIMRQEGYLDASGQVIPTNLAARNNNPGNLRSWGSNPIVGGYAQFPTVEAGLSALRRQVELNISRGLTLEEFFGGKAGVYPGYAPSADRNDPVTYAGNVSLWTGIPTGIPLNSMEAYPLPYSTPTFSTTVYATPLPSGGGGSGARGGAGGGGGISTTLASISNSLSSSISSLVPSWGFLAPEAQASIMIGGIVLLTAVLATAMSSSSSSSRR